MIPDYDGCRRCPLRDRPPIYGMGSTPCNVMIIGEAPGNTEVAQRRPFVGRSGQLLRETLRVVGIDPSGTYITNSVLCHPEGNATPSTAAVEACRDRLLAEIETVKPEKILLVGGTSAKGLLGVSSIVKSRGQGRFVHVNGSSIFTVATYHPAAILRDDDLFRDFVRDIEKLASSSEPLRRPTPVLWVPQTIEELREALDLLFEASVISCDLETTGLSFNKDQILTIGFGAVSEDGLGIGVVIPTRELVEMGGEEEVASFLRLYGGTMVFHNIKFDIQFLRMWLDDWRWQPKKPADTMLMVYAQDERGKSSDATSRGYSTVGLKDQARLRYDIPDYHFDFEDFYATPWEERDWLKFYYYHATDLVLTVRLYNDLRRELEAESSRLLDLVDHLLVPGALAFALVEMIGFPIDVEYLRQLEEETQEKVNLLRTTLQGIAEVNGFKDLNPGSPKQVQAVLDSWGFPTYSTERDILQMNLKTGRWSPDCKEFVESLLEYRQRSKVLETYVRGLLKRVDADGRVRPDFLIHGTDTGRLSCRDPNLQNIPTIMGSEIRHAFMAPEGWSLLNCDFSQLELRVAAFYSRDEQLTKAFLEGADVHRWVASLMFKKPMPEISKFERYLAKYVDFGLLYGRTARALTEGFEAEYILEMTGKRMTQAEADEIQRSFFAAFPGLEGFIQSQHDRVRRDQYIETPTGRRRRFPYLDRTNLGSVGRRSVNTPIQSLASDMTLNAVIRLTRELPDGAYVVSSVHDSIMVICRDEIVEEVREQIRSIMETPVIPEFDVPLRVDIGVGKRWSQMGDE